MAESTAMTRDRGLARKWAIVTGAAGGIGAAVVRALHDEGAFVVALDRDEVGVTRLATDLSSARAPVYASTLDVRHATEVDATIASIEATHGPIDFVVHSAGVLDVAAVTETSDDAWSRIFAVNVQGVFNVSRAAAQRMMPRRRGAMVTISSNAAGIPRGRMAAYAASKAAATMFTRCLGLELAEYGIRCNVVAPGSTRTPMQTAMWQAGSSEATVIAGSLDTYRPGIPLRKLAEPHEIADAVLFLLSNDASHITMADLYVDGGATLRA
jgi:2,3-dihydro-2,3-dihydroxybenzoate dehydrogenase